MAATGEKKPARGGSGDASPPIATAMLDAALREMVDLDDPCCSYSAVARDAFEAMMQVVRTTPELRTAYLQWLAESAPQGFAARQQ